MLASVLLCHLALLASTAISVALPSNQEPIKSFGKKTIFSPPTNYNNPRVLYARSTILADGKTLLATWENYSPEPPLVYFPIYRSTDSGQTWTHISNITDQVNNWGLRYQPFLYTLPRAFAGFPVGTVLAAGNSIPTNLSNTQIDLYASTNQGLSWKFISHIAAGGEALPDNGLTPVWEPFLQLYKGQMIAFYSDQRDPAHGQKLVHQTSKDLRNWGAVVDDVAYAEYTARPGMTTVSELPNGKWFLTYEYGGGPGFSSYSFPVYYRIADSPLEFNNVNGTQLIATDGTQPTGSPYNVWSAFGGRDGTLVVDGSSNAEIFTNDALGDPKKWKKVAVPETAAYTRSLKVLDTQGTVMILSGGPLGGNNTVSNAVIKLS